MQKAIFLDRDGTLNKEAGYINHLERLEFIEGVWTALRIFKELGYKLVVITNQSGLSRGYFSEETLHLVHEKLKKTASQNGATIDALYYCPHHPDGVIEKYKKECNCRKPKPGMLKRAVKELNIDLHASIMIGDRYKDVVFAAKQNLKSIMLLSGYGLGEYCNERQTWADKPDHTCKDLLMAARLIQNRQSDFGN